MSFLRLHFNGKPITPEDTASSLNMQNGDAIEVQELAIPNQYVVIKFKHLMGGGDLWLSLARRKVS